MRHPAPGHRPECAARLAPAGDDPLLASLASAPAAAYDLGRELEGGGGTGRALVAVEPPLSAGRVALADGEAAGATRDAVVRAAHTVSHAVSHAAPLLFDA